MSIFVVMLVAGGISDYIVKEHRLDYRKGQRIQGDVEGLWEEEFAPREYIKIRPKQTKEE